MDYAEASYFDGYHFQHVAAYHEHRRVERIRREGLAVFARRCPALVLHRR